MLFRNVKIVAVSLLKTVTALGIVDVTVTTSLIVYDKTHNNGVTVIITVILGAIVVPVTVTMASTSKVTRS